MKRKLIIVLMFALMSFSLFAAKTNKKEDVKVPNIVLEKCQTLKKYIKNLVQIQKM